MIRFAGAALLLGTAHGAAHALVAAGEAADKDTLSFGADAIAGYIPSSDVVPHSKIDLDMQEVSSLVGSEDFADALFVYEKGGNDKCTQAQIDAATKFGEPASSGGCFEKTTADPVGNSLKKTSVRTLHGFAVAGPDKMAAEKWFNVYKNYWTSVYTPSGATDAQEDAAALKGAKYADTNVRDAFKGEGAFAGASSTIKAEVAKKGVAFQAVWMYVLHEYEDGRMDSEHCEKFRSTLDDMHGQIEDMHADHQAAMAETTTAEEVAAAPAATGGVEYTTEVEKVTEHKPVIQKHEFPYKTGPCATSGATAVALLFSGLLFA